jgi:hypothetical protein
MATLDEKAPRRRHFASLMALHPATWSVLMAILFVVQAADAQNDQQQTSPNVKVQVGFPIYMPSLLIEH